MGKIYLQRKYDGGKQDEDIDEICAGCYFENSRMDKCMKYEMMNTFISCGYGKYIYKQVIPKRLIRSEGNEKKDNR